MFSNLSIKHRLALAFGFVLIVMSLVVIMTSLMSDRSRSIADTISRELSPQVMAADALAMALQDTRTGLRGYIQSGQNKFYSDYQRGVAERRSAFAQLQKQLTDPMDRALLLEMEEQLFVLQGNESRSTDLYRKGEKERAYRCHQLYVRDPAVELADKARELSVRAHSRIAQASDELTQSTSRFMQVSLVSFAIALLAAIIFTVTTIRSITGPAATIAQATQSIAEGDYGKAQALQEPEARDSGSSSGSELKKIAAAVAEMARVLERRESSLTGFADIGRVCASTIELQVLLDDVLAELVNHTRSQVGALYLLKDEALAVAATYGLSEDSASSAITDPSGLVKQVSKSRKTSVISEVPPDTRFSIQSGLGEMIPKTIICVPMVVEGTAPGAVVLASIYELDEEIVEFVETAVAQTGVAVSNALRHLSIEQLADDLRERNEMLDAQNEELQCQNEELQAQSEEIQAQSEEIQAQNEELAAQSAELSEAEARAISDRDHLATIIDTIPEAVVIASAPEGRLTMANKVALKLLGVKSLPDASVLKYSAALSVKKPNGDDFPSDELPLAKALSDGESSSGVELVISHESGDEVIVQMNAVPIRDADGVVTGAIAVFQDISEMKEQQKLRDEIYAHQRYIAKELQKAFLPDPKAHPEMPNYETAAAYEPAHSSRADVGGDFYDLIPLGDGIVGVVMADVSGKGVKAAVYTAMAKYMLRGFAHEDPEPASVIARLNEAFTRYVHGEVFITLFYGILDSHSGRLVYTNAGHEPPMVLRCAEGLCIELDSTGPALGIIQEARYAQEDISLADGDALVLFTDGLSDARKGQHFLGIAGMQEIIAEVGSVGAHDMVASILSRVKSYSDNELRDDVAILVARSLRGNSSSSLEPLADDQRKSEQSGQVSRVASVDRPGNQDDIVGLN